MRHTVKFAGAFKKNRKLMETRGFDLSLLNVVIEMLANGEQLDPKYRNHRLSGKFKGLMECHIESDWLLVYLIDNKTNVLTLVNTGTHSDLF